MKKLNLTERRGFTQIFLLVGMLLIAISLPIVTELVQKNQENRGRAQDFVDEVKCLTSHVVGRDLTPSEKACGTLTNNKDYLFSCNSDGTYGVKVCTNINKECKNGACIAKTSTTETEKDFVDGTEKDFVTGTEEDDVDDEEDVDDEVDDTQKSTVTCTSIGGQCTGGQTCVNEWKGKIITGTDCSGSTTPICCKPVVVTEIKLDKYKATLVVGDSIVIKSTLTPSNPSITVTWSSTNPSVARVDNSGKITGLKAGTVTIKAITSNGRVALVEVTVKSESNVKENGEVCNSNSDCKSNKCFKSYCIDASWNCNPYGTTGSGCDTGKTCVYKDGVFSCTIADGMDTTGVVTGGVAIATNTPECLKIGGICADFKSFKNAAGVDVNNFPYGGSTCSVNNYPGTGDIVTDKCGANGTRVECCAGIAGIDGVCNNSVKNGCSKGVPNDSAVDDTDTYYKWSCVGSYGGATVTNCQKEKSGGSGSSGQTTTLSLVPSTLALKVGETGLVMPSINPKTSTVQTFTWLSSNTAVAITYIPKCSDTLVSKCTSLADTFSVVGVGTSLCSKCAGNENEGLVQARGVGTAIVSVNATPSNVGATMVITVTAAEVAKPSTVLTVAPTVLALKVGESGTVTANQSVTWSSNNASVAQVTVDGVIIAKAKGNTSVTATNAAGNTATVAVTVTEKEVVGEAGKISFKVAFDGVKPYAVNRDTGSTFTCFEYLGDLMVEVLNRTTNAYDTYPDIEFAVDGNEVDSKGNQIFQVSDMKINSSLTGVDTDNVVKVKGLYHLKRRMCKDGQKGKVNENEVCNVDLTGNTSVYDFSEYVLLAGDVNKDGKVDTQDFSIVKTASDAGAEQICNRKYDLNLDGVVNSADTGLIRDHSLAERDDE